MPTQVRLELGGPGQQYRYAVWQSTTGKRRKRSLGHINKVGIREARRRAAAIQVELAEAGEIAGSNATPKIEAWLKRFVAQRDLKKSTIAEYEVTTRLLTKRFGNVRINKIGPDDAADFRAELRKRDISENTTRKHIRNCKALFRTAAKQRIIPSNPFEDQPGSPLRIDADWRYVPQKEVDRLLAACPSIKWQTLIALARFAGLRMKEALRLQWIDVDFDQRLFIVRNTAGKITTKDKERSVPISPELYKILLDRHEAARPGEQRVVGFSISYLQGGGNKDSGRSVLTNIYRRAKVIKGDPLHDLRRSLITDWLDTEEITTDDVAKLCGNSPEIIRRYYHQVLKNKTDLIKGRAESDKDRQIRELQEQLNAIQKERDETEK
jgi:integrase